MGGVATAAVVRWESAEFTPASTAHWGQLGIASNANLRIYSIYSVSCVHRVTDSAPTRSNYA